jgi:outer membrane protein TolC
LTQQQAIERSLTGNADLRRERIAIDVADAQLESSRGVFDFRLSSDATFSRRTTPPISAGSSASTASATSSSRSPVCWRPSPRWARAR